MGFQVPFNLACPAYKIPPPIAEFRFSASRKWMFDWCWPERMLALEVEGGIYGRGKPCPVCKRKPPGAHSSIQRLLSDMEKYNEAAILGWKVIRCQPEDLATGAVFALLKRAFGIIGTI